MKRNEINPYEIEPHIAEIYDQYETGTDDVDLIRRLVEESAVAGRPGGLNVLEPFCGTGRILIPLAMDGHSLTGIDQSPSMLARAREKAAGLPESARGRIVLQQANAVYHPWPGGFDLVILGGSCFYELATPEEQERLIRNTAAALKSGGYVYIDNNHMEGELDASWQNIGADPRKVFDGMCTDGAHVETSMETIWFDAPNRLVRFRRSVRVVYPDGEELQKEYIQQKHPVSAAEVRSWLEKHGFVVERLMGSRLGEGYTDCSDRAIFWARKMGE